MNSEEDVSNKVIEKILKQFKRKGGDGKLDVTRRWIFRPEVNQKDKKI